MPNGNFSTKLMPLPNRHHGNSSDSFVGEDRFLISVFRLQGPYCRPTVGPRVKAGIVDCSALQGEETAALSGLPSKFRPTQIGFMRKKGGLLAEGYFR
jgi:hypothetical protein